MMRKSSTINQIIRKWWKNGTTRTATFDWHWKIM